MPVVISDPLCKQILDILQSGAKHSEDQDTKEKFHSLAERLQAAPTWRAGQAYANPPLVTVEKSKTKN